MTLERQSNSQQGTHSNILSESVVNYIDFHARGLGRKLGRFNFNVEVDDLVQAGFLGALDAERRYDPGTGLQFKTFAKRRIRGAMIQLIRESGNIPPSAARKVSRLKRTEANYARLGQPLPGDEELSKEIGLSANEIPTVREYASLRFISREELMTRRPMGDDETNEIEKLTPEQLGKLRSDENTILDLQIALSSISEAEKRVILLQHLAGYAQEEIASLLKLSTTEVADISSQAVKKMRTALNLPDETRPVKTPKLERTIPASTRERKSPKLAMEPPAGYISLRGVLQEIGISYSSFKNRKINEGIEMIPVGHGGTIYINQDSVEIIKAKLVEQGWQPPVESISIKPQALPALRRLLSAIPGFAENVGVETYIEMLNRHESLDQAQIDQIKDVLSPILSPLELNVMLARIGLNGQYMSLERTGAMFNRDLKGIQQIEKKAVEKLTISLQ